MEVTVAVWLDVALSEPDIVWVRVCELVCVVEAVCVSLGVPGRDALPDWLGVAVKLDVCVEL